MLSHSSPIAFPNIAAPHETALVSNVAVALKDLITLHAQTALVVLAVEGAVRLCPTGTEPTAALGFKLESGDTVSLSRAEADAAQLIRAQGSDVAIQVAQFK